MSEIWRKQDVIDCTYNERTTKAALAASSAITSCSTTISFITGIPPNTAAITCFCAVLTAHYPCSASNPQVLQTQQECRVLGSTGRTYTGIIEGISAAELERIAKEEERKWFWQNGKEKEEKEQSVYKELKSLGQKCAGGGGVCGLTGCSNDDRRLRARRPQESRARVAAVSCAPRMRLRSPPPPDQRAIIAYAGKSKSFQCSAVQW
ncbi:unnamed protein product [Spodoptera exigua]|nr:unnamed protein product [Spodoptera exigua]